MHLLALRKIYSRSLPESKSLGERDREGALELATIEIFAFGILLGAAFTLGTCSVLGLAPTSPGKEGEVGEEETEEGEEQGGKGRREEKGEGEEKKQEEVVEEGQAQLQYSVLSMYPSPPW